MLEQFWGDIFWLNLPMFEVLQLLKKKGLKLVLLSNTNSLHYEYIKKDYPDVIGLFDEVVLSFEKGLDKSSKQLFEMALEKASKLVGDNKCITLYVDDVEKNVEMAESVGMRGFVFESHSHFMFWLRKAGLYLS